MIVRAYVEEQTADNDGCRLYVLPSLRHHQVGTYKRDEPRSSRRIDLGWKSTQRRIGVVAMHNAARQE